MEKLYSYYEFMNLVFHISEDGSEITLMSETFSD